MKFTLSVVGLMALAPLIVSAQPLPSPPPLAPGSFINLLCSIAGWVFVFLIILSILAVLYAAFMYLTSLGNPEKVQSANRQLIFAAVGVAVAIFAKGLPNLVAGLIGTSIPTQC